MEQRTEQGSALVAVLLLLMMMSALAAALAVSGQTETLIVRNQRSAAQAHAAAEAGLNHAVAVTIAYLLEAQAGGLELEEVTSALLRGPDGDSGTEDTDIDNGSLEALTGWGIATGERGTITVGVSAEYEARVMDEDDPERDGYTVMGGAENDDPTSDLNGTLVVHAVGYASDDTSVVLEALISRYKLPAVVSNGDLEINGAAGMQIIVGADGNGGVHANGDLTFNGLGTVLGVPDIDKGTATASGTCEPCATVTSNPDASGGSMAEIAIPEIDATAFRDSAEYILTSAGAWTNVVTGLQVDCSGAGNPCLSIGWRFNSGDWELASSAATGVFYVEGPVTFAPTGVTPVAATIIAEGSISATGGTIQPAASTPDLLFVTGGDLDLGGNFSANLVQGQILVHEQVDINGTVAILRQLVIENATPGTDMTVADGDNAIGGSVVISNDGDVGTAFFHLTGWREVK